LPQASTRNIPSAKREHSDESLLLALADLEAPNYREGKKQDDHILSNVQPGCGEPYDILVHTLPTAQRLVPEEIDWVANKHITKDAPRATSNDYAQHSITGATKAAYREDTNVLDKN
jgi:hypothetical protein